jgi:hypothetical protein
MRPLAEFWINRGIERLANTFPLPAQASVLQDMMRTGVWVVLNGLTPTAYTRQLSPYNVWLMRLLLGLPHVRYKQGQISKLAQRVGDHRYDVTFDDGTVETFDRTVTRYGSCGGAGLAAGLR